MITNKNIKKQALLLLTFAMLMLGLSYAAVPLYKLFCQVTGYGGTPLISENKYVKVTEAIIDIRFDSSVEKNSPIL